MSVTPLVDWPALFRRLEAAGLTQDEIAQRCGKSQAWVWAARNGQYKDLPHSTGEFLLALDRKLIRKREKLGMRLVA